MLKKLLYAEAINFHLNESCQYGKESEIRIFELTNRECHEEEEDFLQKIKGIWKL